MKYISVVPPCYIPPRSGPIFPISSCSLPYGGEEPCGSNSFVVWTSSIFIFIPVFVMFVSWDERIALVNSALCHAYIYACATEPSMDAHGKDAQRHEGLAYREADHFQTLRDRHMGNGLYFRAKVERKRDPGLLALSFDVDLTGCHVMHHLVQNISRTLVTQHVLKFASTRLQKTVDFGIYKIFEDLFPSKDERYSMFLEGIHDENLNQISSNARNEPSSGAAAETVLGAVLGSKY